MNIELREDDVKMYHTYMNMVTDPTSSIKQIRDMAHMLASLTYAKVRATEILNNAAESAAQKEMNRNG